MIWAPRCSGAESGRCASALSTLRLNSASHISSSLGVNFQSEREAVSGQPRGKEDGDEDCDEDCEMSSPSGITHTPGKTKNPQSFKG